MSYFSVTGHSGHCINYFVLVINGNAASVAEQVEALALPGTPQSGRSPVLSRVAAGAKYGQFSSRKKSHGFPRNSIMPTMDMPLISSGFSSTTCWPVRVK